MASLDTLQPLPRRLRKRAAQQLGLSLPSVDAHWQAGRLTVITPTNREPHALPLEALLFPEDQLLCDGAALPGASEADCVYALLNKPKHMTSTAADPNGERDLSLYLRGLPAGCFAVGRLDRETTGLLLFTNDGDLASAVLRPDQHTSKTYWLWLDDVLADDDPRLAQLTTGIMHDGRLLTAQAARVSSRTDYATELELTLTQGRKRQIRHMCRALDLHLVHLHRKRIGPLSDAGLELGGIRYLEPAEVEALWNALGGRSALRARKVAALARQAAESRAAGAPQLRLERWLELDRGP